MARYKYLFCPQCGTPLHNRVLHFRLRAACPSCDFIHFEDPKVAVVAFITCRNRILLIQRAVDPEKGKWALPGGYMDAGELPVEALRRELMEEVDLEITKEQILRTYPLMADPLEDGEPQSTDLENVGVILVYQATPASGETEPLVCQDDVQNANWFKKNEIPSDLAFDLTEELLAEWSC